MSNVICLKFQKFAQKLLNAEDFIYFTANHITRLL